MLAWVMNMGFAASAAATTTATPKSFALGLSMLKLGGMVFLALLMIG